MQRKEPCHAPTPVCSPDLTASGAERQPGPAIHRPLLRARRAPCVAGSVYDAACDVNHDGIIDVVDIQLSAGHWSQTGLYTADGWLLTGNAGTNAATNFLGTTDAQPLVFKVNNQQALRLERNDQQAPSIIGGYQGNLVHAGVFGAVIAGGGDDGAEENRVTDHHGTVSGGHANLAGNYNGSLSDATDATVAGGFYNAASREGAAVGGGSWNWAYGTFSSIPGGFGAKASHYGELAHASGYFDLTFSPGNAQASTYVLRREIPSNAGNRELFLDEFGERITLAANRALAFDVLIVARSNTGETSAWRVEGVVENSGGTTALIGTPIKTTLGEDDIVWDVAVQANDVNDALAIIGYSNQSGDTIRFVASVRTTEVAW